MSVLKHTPRVLVVYTGGTIGMIKDDESGALIPLDFVHISDHVPELKRFRFDIRTVSFENVIDSSNVSPEIWVKLANLIYDSYDAYDGFVVLHGTDTMSYTASALSFTLRNLGKPIIFTGSQLPIGTLRSDGKMNLITAVEIAAARHHGNAIVPEVCVFFENKLYRGNRSSKQNAEFFDAFRSGNYPALADVGINIRYNYAAIRYPRSQNLELHCEFNTQVAVLKLFPGLSREVMMAIISIPGLRGLVLESFGAGNAPTFPWFLACLEAAVAKDIIVLNITQCFAGTVMMGHYDTSLAMLKMGVVNGKDLTTEAAVTKMMFLLGQDYDFAKIKALAQTPIAGEMSAV